MNNVILMGRLCKDPIIRYSSGENPVAVAMFSLAVDRRFAKRDDANAQTADFINIVAIGRNGEFADKWLRQGTKVCLRGRLQTGSYTNKEGQKVFTTEVMTEEIEFAESKKQDAPAEKPKPASLVPPKTDESEFVNLPDDDIETDLPFA